MSHLHSSQKVQHSLHETVKKCPPDNNLPHHQNKHQLLSEYQGAQIDEKHKDVFGIEFININGIPKQHNNPKNKNIEETLLKYYFDYFGFAETNCYWPLAEDENKWHERIHNWNISHSKSILSYYTKPLVPELHQPGGVISMAIGYTTSRVFSSGKDEILGRWSWITLRGKHNIKTTIITGYRPCDNTSGTNNVCLQQQRYLQVKQIDECPREIWLKEISVLIQSKLQAGEQIILLADMNDSVITTNRLHKWADKLGLREAVSPTAMTEIPTYQKGKKALDGIYTSYSLQTLQAGYFPFGEIQ